MASTQYYNDIQKLYVAYFNRPADPGGLAFWESTLEANKGDIATVAANFAAQAEYKLTFTGMTNEQIVNQVYMNLFGRPADDAGKKFYADFMTAGKLSIDQVVLEVANGAKGNSDGQIFANKVAAATAFTAALDTQAEVAGYTTESAPLAKAFLAGVTTGGTLDAALLPANLNKAVGDLVAKGTPFTVTGALATLTAATDAQKAFYVSADGDNDATTSATHTTLLAAQTTAAGDVHDLFLDSTAAVTFAAATSTSVRAALIGDQVTAYATAIQQAQADVATAKTAVNAVAGLSSAITARDAAQASADAAATADTAATADLAAKVAAYNINHASAQLAFNVSTHAVTEGGAAVFTVDATTGKFVLASTVTETNHAGITAVLGSANTLKTADAAVVSTTASLTTATDNVHHLDVSPAEAADLASLAADMGLTTTPTAAQITTFAANNTGNTTFNGHLAAYNGHLATDPKVAALDAATDTLSSLVDNSADFNTAVTALNAATATLAQEAGFTASVASAASAFDIAGYNYVDFSTGGSLIATTDSDVYVAGTTGGSINLFGLQGKDVIAVGSGYTVNTGALTTGSDSAKEVFIHADTVTPGNAIVQIETHAFSSHVSATAGELVTITLTGVDAAKLHLDASTGIISLS